MKTKFFFICLMVVHSFILQSAPIVQKIMNNSDIGFMVIFHSDTSACSIHKQNVEIPNRSDLVEDFLLETSVDIHRNVISKQELKASLILRPIYYYDLLHDEKMFLVNDDYDYDMQKVEAAYVAWKQGGKKRKFKDAQHWLDRWVGKDIIIMPDKIEASGYIMHLSRGYVYNQKCEHGQWLSHAKGVFARLIVDISIDQYDRKGICPTLKVSAGEGGICKSGVVGRI